MPRAPNALSDGLQLEVSEMKFERFPSGAALRRMGFSQRTNKGDAKAQYQRRKARLDIAHSKRQAWRDEWHPLAFPNKRIQIKSSPAAWKPPPPPEGQATEQVCFIYHSALRFGHARACAYAHCRLFITIHAVWTLRATTALCYIDELCWLTFTTGRSCCQGCSASG